MTVEYLDRMALVVRPSQRYIDCANAFDDGGPKYNPECHHARAYLIDEVVDASDITQVLRCYWRGIFEKELGTWMRDPDVFYVTVSDLMPDCGRGPMNLD